MHSHNAMRLYPVRALCMHNRVSFRPESMSAKWWTKPTFLTWKKSCNARTAAKSWFRMRKVFWDHFAYHVFMRVPQRIFWGSQLMKRKSIFIGVLWRQSWAALMCMYRQIQFLEPIQRENISKYEPNNEKRRVSCARCNTSAVNIKNGE